MDFSTIGGLYEALGTLDPSASVYIDNRPPTALSSYRGYYNQLAVARTEVRHERTELDGRGSPFDLNMAGYGTYSPGNGEVRIKADPTVSDFAAALRLATGEVFEGYKGGQYTMRSGTDLWVSEYGEVQSLRIVAFETFPGRVDLTTRDEGF